MDTDAFWYMCFFKPPTVSKKEKKDINVIVVDYNAWEYSGCDYLWAGIVTRLGESIEARFGTWKVRICRLMIKMANQQSSYVSSLKLKCGYFRCKFFVLLMAAVSFLILTTAFLTIIFQDGNDHVKNGKKHLAAWILLITSVASILGTVLTGI